MPRNGFKTITVSDETYDMLEKERRLFATEKGLQQKDVSFEMTLNNQAKLRQLKREAKVKI